jgi:Ala-tRNA(Pro) deacylase
MAISKKLKQILEEAHINYEILEHNPAFTALETAHAQHIPGRQLVKTVIVHADEKMIMCVLSSVKKIDFSKLKQMLGIKEAYLAPETELAELFPEYEVGAEPPFNPAEMPIYIDKTLEENDVIVFNAGSHVEMIRMKFKDYIAFAQPIVLDFSSSRK